MRIYFANCLFNEASLLFNETVVREIESQYPEVSVYLPQRNEAINDKTSYADSSAIVKADYDELEKADILVAVLDNGDTGVALEIGMFYMMDKPIIGLYSDTRRMAFGNEQKKDALDVLGENQVSYVNLMVVGAVKEKGVLVDSSQNVISELGKILHKK